VAKWRKRTTVGDAPMGPHHPPVDIFIEAVRLSIAFFTMQLGSG